MASLDYISRAFLAGNMLVIVCAFLSPFLVLSRQSLIADGMSHASFLGFVAGAIIVKEEVYIAILITILLTIIFRLIVDLGKIKPDSTIGIIATIGLSLGMIILARFRGEITVSFHALMQGSILSVSNDEVLLFGSILLLIIVLLITFYRQLFKITFDSEYARVTKTNTILYKYLLSIITSVIVVVGVKMIGVLLISTLIIFPTLISTKFKRSFFQTIVLAIIVSLFAFNIGLGIAFAPSFNQDPPSALIALSFVVLFLIISIITYIIRLVKQKTIKR